MSLTHQTDHSGAAFARFVERMKTIQGFRAFLDAFISPMQSIEDALWQIFTTTGIRGAGYQLDALGRLLGEPRDGFDDAHYKVRLTAKIRVLRSSGGPLDILTIFKLLLPTNVLKFTVLSGAAFILEIGDVDTAYEGIYTRFLHEAKSAGINGQLHFTYSDTAEIFEMDDGSTLAVQAPAGQTYFAPVNAQSFGIGDLAVISWGLSNAENRVVTNGPLDTVGVAALTYLHVVNSAVSKVAGAGTFATLTSASAITATVVLCGNHPFLVGDWVTFDPGLPTEEDRQVTAKTSTTITVVGLNYGHANGSFIIKRLQRGWSNAVDNTVGGQFSGVFV